MKYLALYLLYMGNYHQYDEQFNDLGIGPDRAMGAYLSLEACTRAANDWTKRAPSGIRRWCEASPVNLLAQPADFANSLKDWK
jgi:hypothetical protein